MTNKKMRGADAVLTIGGNKLSADGPVALTELVYQGSKDANESPSVVYQGVSDFIKEVAQRVENRPEWQRGGIDRPAHTNERKYEANEIFSSLEAELKDMDYRFCKLAKTFHKVCNISMKHCDPEGVAKLSALLEYKK